MPRHRSVVDEMAFTTLMVLSDPEIAALLPAIEAIAENPSTTPDFYTLDKVGRRIPGKVAGDFLMTYWVDRETATVFILRIDRLET